MKCPKCDSELRKVKVRVEGAVNKAISYQCSNEDCLYYEFDKDSTEKAIEELKGNSRFKKIEICH